jgi:CRP/FNR family transcriptional regulator
MLSTQSLESEQGRRELDHSPNFSIRDLFHIESIKISKLYPRGSTLFVEGQRPAGVHILCEGRAKVSLASPEGKVVVLRIAEAGDVLGVSSVLFGLPARATVETLECCRIAFVSREEFLKLLDQNERAYAAVLHALNKKLSGMMDHARLLLLSHTAAEKLARLLLKWCDEHGKTTSNGIRIDSGLTHEEIAQVICTSRETVTRLLGEFKQDRIVTLTDSAIFVRNRQALEAVARVREANA